MPTLRIETIGRSVAYIGERRIDPSAEVVFAAVLYLALERGRRIPRGEIADLFWPDTPRAVRSGRLRWLLSKLRNVGLPLEAGAMELWLDSTTVMVDARKPGIFDESWFSGVLPHYEPSISAAFHAWVEQQKDVLRANLIGAAEGQIPSMLQRGEDGEAIRVAEWLQAADESNERAVLWFAECACRLNQTSRAVTALEEFIALNDERASLRATLTLRRIRSVSQGSATRRDQRFVGRREQLQRLQGFLESAVQERGGALLLTGPSGIGKTRLLDEVRDRARAWGFRTAVVRCQRGDVQRPLSGLVELTTALLKLPGAAGCAPEHHARLQALTHHTSVDEEPGFELASPGVRQARLLEALADLIAAISDEAPLLIQVDDAQWFDASLAWIWNELVRRSEYVRVAFIFAVRTSRRSAPALEAPTVIIGALEAEAAAELLDDLLIAQERVASDEIKRMILSRGAGSPLFLRELVRQWATNGACETLPTSLVGLFESALSALSPSAVRTLQVAAILGTYATVERIEKVVQLPRAAFLDALVELEGAGVFTTDHDGAVSGHVLWAEAASGLVSANLERVLHRHAAELLELEVQERPTTSLLWESARHWERSGHPERARRAILAGAEHLSRNGFPQDAIAAYDRVLQTIKDPIERLPILEQRIHALLTSAKWREALAEIDAFQELSSEVAPSFDRHNELEVASYRARYAVGDIASVLPEALACSFCDRATIAHRLAAAKKCSQAAELVDVSVLHQLHAAWDSYCPRNSDEEWDLYCLKWVYEYRLGDPHEAFRVSTLMLERQRTAGNYQRTINTLQHVASSCFVTGAIGDGFKALHDSMQLARVRGDLDNLGVSYDQLIGYTFDFESLDLAERRLREAIGLARRISVGGAYLVADVVLPAYQAQLAVMRRQPTEGLRLIGPLKDSLSVPVARWRVRLLAIHLSAHMQLGNTGPARAIAEPLALCFHEADVWRDWPAEVYAAYLEQYESADQAVRFASDFISRLRRELHEPPETLVRLGQAASNPR